jgi:hypothetical protein
MSVNVWIVFSSVYSRDIAYSEGKEYLEYTAHPIPPEILQPTLSSFIKPGLEFLTSLSISGQAMSRAQWVSLAQLQNLSILFIDRSDYPRDSEDDRLDGQVIRAWGTHALEAGGFPQLRVLLLLGQQVISPDVLHHLSDLPILQFCSLGTTREQLAYNPAGADAQSCWECWSEGSMCVWYCRRDCDTED